MAKHLIKSFKKKCGQVTANDRLFQKVLLKGNNIRINKLNANATLSDKEKEHLSTLPFAHSIELQALKELNLTAESIENTDLRQKINDKKGEIMEKIYEDGYSEVFDSIRTSIPLKKTETLHDLNSQLVTITERLAQNDWKIIDAAQPAHNTPPPLCYSSTWLSMNVLVLDPKTVCVEKSEVYQAEQMDKLGMEVVPVDLRDAYAFGGGLHCCTADAFREGSCEDYFPNRA